MSFRKALAHLISDADIGAWQGDALANGPRRPDTTPDRPDEPHNPDRPSQSPDESPAQYPDHPNEPIEIT